MASLLRLMCVLFIYLGISEKTSNAYNILVIFPFNGKSHFAVVETYLEELAAKGHQLVVVSHFPRKKPIPNYKDVDIRGVLSTRKTVNFMEFKDMQNGRSQVLSAISLGIWGAQVCEKTMKHPEVQKLIESDEKFDLLVIEAFNTDCFLAFGYKFQIPIIAFSACIFLPWIPGRVGNPDNPSYIPTHFAQTSDKMDFYGRFRNFLSYVFHHVTAPILLDFPALGIAAKHFGDTLPTLSQLARNTSLFFVNTHFSINGPRPLVPGVVEIGGIHINRPKKLSLVS